MENVWLNPKYAETRAETAVFADRDGTLIRHLDYLSDPAEVELLPGVREAVHRLLAANIPFCILTNQSGVGRGYFPIERVHACQRRLFELLELHPSRIAGWCVAPEAPGTEGGYRKPSPRFILEACAHLGLPTADCHMIGDTLVDLETAWNAGAQAWAVACGKPKLPEQIAAGTILGPHKFRHDFPACVRSIIG
ncbi:MAG: D-glycero-alpha-D-manno-heptose-1,7-bisphosphate 7-phosphatase [Opitutales bacterium]